MVYDWRFRLKASAKNIKIWSAIEVTIWNMVFPDYTLGSQQPGRSLPMIPANAYRPPRLPASEPRHQICLQWNKNPNGCPRPSCRFEHICYRCVHNPRVSDKIHKALECPHKEKRTAPQQHQGPPEPLNLLQVMCSSVLFLTYIACLNKCVQIIIHHSCYSFHLSVPLALSSEHIVGIHLDDICSPYKEWIPAWNTHLSDSPVDVRVPQEARVITTPLIAKNWALLLSTYPNQELVQFFLTGISEDFRIGFKSQPKPLKSAI